MSKSTESFESIKSDIISFLKDIEKKENSNELKKAIDYFTSTESLVTCLDKSENGTWIEKAGYGVGTIRIWKGKKYKKISASPVRWVRVFDKVDRGAKSAMTRLIHKAESIDNPEEMMKFLLENKQRFYNEDQKRYTGLVDRLNAFIDSKEYKQTNKVQNKTKGASSIIRTALENSPDEVQKYIDDTKEIINHWKEEKNQSKHIKEVIAAQENNIKDFERAKNTSEVINSPEKATDEELKTQLDFLKNELEVAKENIRIENGTYADKMTVKLVPGYINKLEIEIKNRKKESKKESPTITFDRKGIIGKKAVNYGAVKSVPTDSPSGPKEALEKATVEDYDYNSTTKGKMVTIPGSKEVLDAFKRLDSIVDHSVHWKSNYIYTRHFGIQDGYLYTTDGRQAKRVKIDGLDGLPERGMYDAKIENGNLVLKEQPNIGDFPLFKKVIPQDNDKSLRLDNKALKDKLKDLKAAKYFTKDSPFIDLKIKNGKIMIGNTQIGKTENYSGDNFNIRMNNEFLLNSLSKGDSSILNFAEDFTTDEKGNKYAIKVMGISENTGDNIMIPSQPYKELADPDEHLKETSERNSNLKNAAINSITSELNGDRFKDVDQKLKDRAIKFMGNHESKYLLKDVYSLTQALPFVHKILNEKQFIDMGLKPEFGKTDGSKYVRFRDKNGEPTGSHVFDNPVVAKFFKELAKDGVFGEMKKSELRDMTSLESYVKKSISILKKSLIG